MNRHRLPDPVGAYGFRVDPDVFGRRYLHAAAPDWPELTVQLGVPSPPEQDGWREAFAADDWTVRVRRGGGAAWWSGAAALSTDARVHPLLSLVACAATLERGGDCLHAGAVLTPDGVVAVLAARGGGKTSTMAWLAFEAGLDVFTDDQLTLRDGLAHAGPGCLDLRPDAAERLGLRSQGREVRSGERIRLEVKPPACLRAPVIGTAVLEWGPDLRISSVPPQERLALLCTHRTVPMVDGDLGVPLRLAALPMLRVRRPPTFDNLPRIARALLDG
ncbi:hypothetical protein [Jidongwangia harbinensis]|uniref:hypothetical protein n=1 Tax=Jidongwangia harbinensis TaxID=2878561 RepID=UPI001CD9D824|nr:hypothetical protein [Jidongwangia harbinensis]MCA2214303.1 hypothetical protein [Jidongwangia harbinensis]